MNIIVKGIGISACIGANVIGTAVGRVTGHIASNMALGDVLEVQEEDKKPVRIVKAVLKEAATVSAGSCTGVMTTGTIVKAMEWIAK